MSERHLSEEPDLPVWLVEAAVIPGEFPLERMREVWARGGEIEAALVGYLEWLAGPERPGMNLAEDDWLPMVGFYLLADRGCGGLFDPLVELASDEDYAGHLLGDCLTEDLSGWLRACGRDRVEDLRQIISEPRHCQWLRCAALNALGGLAWEGSISRDEHERYLESLPDTLPEEGECVWNQWIQQVASFRLESALPKVGAAERKGLLDFGEGVASTKARMLLPDLECEAEAEFFRTRPGGAEGLETLSKFICFESGCRERIEAAAKAAREHEEERKRRDAEYKLGPVQFTAYSPPPPAEPVKRTGPKVGRNDPCPCGSGKKFKKCCEGAA